MRLNRAALLRVAPSLLLLAACQEATPAGVAQSPQPPGEKLTSPGTVQAGVQPVQAALPPDEIEAPPPILASVSPAGQAINQAEWTSQPANPGERRQVLVRAQVLLDRANFSPGVVDGLAGGNLRKAIAAFEAARGLPQDGQLDAQVWRALTEDGAPAMTDYMITQEDVAGPFVDQIPKDYAQMSKLERLAFTSPLELLAEKFHMDQSLLKALNPQADFSQPGTNIVVAAPRTAALPDVTLVEVDKTEEQVRAYAADGSLVAAYPATVGSAALPAPSGEWAVRAVAHNPTWTYDPERLSFGDKAAGKLTIAAGPNNPVGAVWIDLTKDTYGIHGSPDPALIGKTASHGCVRLTNWDARQLARAVAQGTKVVFLGSEKPAGRRS